ncbi:EpsG family protein [Telluria sp. B2]
MRKSKRKIILAFVGLLGFFLASAQIFGISPDYENYNAFIDLTRQEGANVLMTTRFEVGFSLIVIILTQFFSSNAIVYGAIAGASLWLKAAIFRIFASSQKIFLIGVAFYLTRYFSLHELTQLRAACAIGIILFGSAFIWKGKTFWGLVICCLALSLHMSVAAIIPALFFRANKRWKVALIGIVVFLSVFLLIGLVTSYLANHILVLDSYQTNGFHEVLPNPFAMQLLIDWAMILAAFIRWNALTPLMKRIVLIEVVGLAIFYGGMDYGSVAHRVREAYTIFWVIFVMDGLRLKAMRSQAKLFIAVCVLFYSYLFFMSGNFFS